MTSGRFAAVEVDGLLETPSGVVEYNPSGAPTFPRWSALLGALERAGVRTVSQLGLLSGGIAYGEGPAVLFVLRNQDEETAAWLTDAMTSMLSTLLWAVPAERVRPDWSHLLGAGVVCASAGYSGRPLVGMGVGELREELARSRNWMHDTLGYAPRAVCPAPDANGVAVDGLVEREAKRAGYAMILEPGLGLQGSDLSRFSARTVRDDDSIDELAGWISGESWLRIRHLANHHAGRWFA